MDEILSPFKVKVTEIKLIVKMSAHPLAVEWSRRHHPSTQWFPYYPLDWGDINLSPQLTERIGCARRQIECWILDRDSSVEQEIVLIEGLVAAAIDRSRRRYCDIRQRLIDLGYAAKAMETIPEPPPEIEARFFGEEGYRPDNYRILDQAGKEVRDPENNIIYNADASLLDETGTEVGRQRLKFSPCGWHNTSTRTIQLLAILQPDWVEPDPTSPFPDDRTPTGLYDNEALYRRRCMKAAGQLMTVAEAAHFLNCSKSNISQLIRRGHLSSWPDPDDRRIRLVMRRELETQRVKLQRGERHPA